MSGYSADEARPVLGRGQPALGPLPEPAVSVAGDEPVDGVAQATWEEAQGGGQFAVDTAEQLAGAEGALAFRVYLAVVIEDEAGEVGGVYAEGRQELPRQVRLQAGEADFPPPVVAQEVLHGAVAEVTDAVEEQDGVSGLFHGGLTTGGGHSSGAGPYLDAPMTAVLVEDLAPALAALEADLARHCPTVEVIGTAAGVVEAAKLLRQRQPDLLILDIMLGDGTSFDLLEIFPDLRSQLIFVTASDEFALRAFRFAAVDYLLKPVDPEQLRQAVQRAAERKGQTAAPSLNLLRETLSKPDVLPERISLHTSENILLVNIQDIIRCESDGNNTWFYIEGRKRAFVTKTLKHYERLLTDHHFVRIHQSHLVNLRHVVEFKKVDSGYLRLTNGDEVPVASRKRAEVVKLLG